MPPVLGSQSRMPAALLPLTLTTLAQEEPAAVRMAPRFFIT